MAEALTSARSDSASRCARSILSWNDKRESRGLRRTRFRGRHYLLFRRRTSERAESVDRKIRGGSCVRSAKELGEIQGVPDNEGHRPTFIIVDRCTSNDHSIMTNVPPVLPLWSGYRLPSDSNVRVELITVLYSTAAIDDPGHSLGGATYVR